MLSRSDTDVPQPGFVGANYDAHRVLLVGQNPAQPKTSLERDQPYMDALHQLGRSPTDASLAHYNATVRAYMEHWPITRSYFPLERCGLTVDDIAYCNLVRCRTDDDAAPGPRLVGACVATHFDDWLAALAPRVVVFIGKWAADRGAPSCVRGGIPFTWLSRQRNLTATAREQTLAMVAQVLRAAAENTAPTRSRMPNHR